MPSKTQTRIGLGVSVLSAIVLVGQILATAPALDAATIGLAVAAGLVNLFGTKKAADGPGLKN